jgi:hypothetical protein
MGSLIKYVYPAIIIPENGRFLADTSDFPGAFRGKNTSASKIGAIQ